MASLRVRENYRTVNGCKRQFECQQIFWVLAMVILVILYSVFVVPAIIQWDNLPLLVCMTIAYVLILPVVYDFFKLTCIDPVDPNIINQQHYSPSQSTKKCSICKLDVRSQTEHCLSCQRCTEHMDHHSQLVNNCISIKNITNYIRLNICFCLVMGIILGQSSAIFLLSFSNSELSAHIINKWIILLLVLMAFLGFGFSLGNSLFSCYLRAKGMTRIGYRFRQTDSNNSDYSDSENMQIESQSKE